MERSRTGQKSVNRAAILHAIARHGQVARVDIARETGVNQSSLTALTAELLDEGVLQETHGSGKSQRGRPPVALRLRAEAHLVAGVKVTDGRLFAAILDFAGHRLAESELRLAERANSAKTLCAAIKDAVVAAAQKIDRKPEDISALGIGLPGFVEFEAQRVHWSPFLIDGDADFAAALDDLFPCPVVIDNDVNLAALAEQKLGLGRGLDNFMVLTVEHGVGMGLVIGGKLFRGQRGVGTEFGHTKVQIDGALCRCGQRGCLEAYVADYALVREWVALGDGGGQAARPVPELMAELNQAAEDDHPVAQRILDRAAHIFGIGLSNLINVFDPGHVIIAGEQIKYDYLFSDTAHAAMRQNVLATSRKLPEVRIHNWSNTLWAAGAGALAIERVIDALA